MKSAGILNPRERSGAAKTGLTILVLALSGAVVLAEPSPHPSASKAPDKSSSPTPEKTPDTTIDEKTEADLLQAEERFNSAILNADTKELTEMLHELYADAFGKHAKRAINKRGTLERARKERLFAYRIEKQRKIIRSGDSFTIEGLAKAERRIRGDEPTDKWFQVQRIWTKTQGGWVLNAQSVATVTEPIPAAETKPSENN